MYLICYSDNYDFHSVIRTSVTKPFIELALTSHVPLKFKIYAKLAYTKTLNICQVQYRLSSNNIKNGTTIWQVENNLGRRFYLGSLKTSVTRIVGTVFVK